MNQLVALLQERFNLDEDTAMQIIETVAEFAKERLPESLQGMVDKALNGEDIAGGLGGMISGLFGKGK